MPVDTKISVRHPYGGEVVPAELIQGFEAYKIDPDWQWILVVDGMVKAQMLCANAHGILMILRLTAQSDAPYGWAVKLFRQVMKDAKFAGCIGFMTFLADQNPAEVQLMRIVQRLDGYLLPQSGAWAAASVDIAY